MPIYRFKPSQSLLCALPSWATPYTRKAWLFLVTIRIPRIRSCGVTAVGVAVYYFIAIGAVAETALPAAGNDNAELLKSVIVQNKAARERLRAYTIEQEWKTSNPYIVGESSSDRPHEDMTVSYWAKITKQGDLIHLDRKEHLETVSGKWTDDRFVQCVGNAEYIAQNFRLQRADPMVTVWEHDSPDKACREAKQTVEGFSKPCALNYGFGDDSFDLDHAFEFAHPRIHWSIENGEFEGAPVYRIVRTITSKDGKLKKLSCFYLDPRKGFLLSGMQFFDFDGSLLESISSELDRIENSDVWYPKKVHVRDIEGKTEMWIAIRQFKANPEANAAEFTISSFDIAADSRMVRSTVKGGELWYRFRDGKWVPGK